MLGIVLGRPKISKKKGPGFYIQALVFILVGATGFEPAALGSQNRCATKLRYAPKSAGCTQARLTLSTAFSARAGQARGQAVETRHATGHRFAHRFRHPGPLCRADEGRPLARGPGGADRGPLPRSPGAQHCPGRFSAAGKPHPLPAPGHLCERCRSGRGLKPLHPHRAARKPDFPCAGQRPLVVSRGQSRFLVAGGAGV